MTYEELLEAKQNIEKLEHDLRVYNDNVYIHEYVTLEDLVLVIECMGKQIARKPYGDANCFACPSCGREYECTPLRPKHCDNCGQAFDLSDIPDWEDMDWDFY